MNVLHFIKTRQQYWKALEALVSELRKGNSLDAKAMDKLSQYYRAATSDYAYANTYYPDHRITQYLNKLVSEAHGLVYQRRKMPIRNVWNWFTFNVPSLFKEHIGAFLFSLFTMTLFFWIGFGGSELMEDGEKVFFMFSITNPEAGFERAEGYIKMTEENIAEGRPFRVYEDEYQAEMFSGIMFNNIQVAVYAFVGGIFAGIMTWFVLARTGMMLGAFFHIFYRHDLAFEFWNTVLIHGMIELTMIVMAGGAGFIIAKGLLFPGRFTRKDSLIKSGLAAVQIAVVIAAWLGLAALQESYLTAYLHPKWMQEIIVLEPFNLADVLQAAVNLISLSLMVFYFGALGTGITKDKIGTTPKALRISIAAICGLLLLPFAAVLLMPVVTMWRRDVRKGKLKQADWVWITGAFILGPASILPWLPILAYILIADKREKTQKIYKLAQN